MGKLVTFWSPYAGHAKVTSSMCAIAGIFGMQYPEYDIAITHTKKNSMELEEMLDSQTGQEIKQEIYKKSGITALKINCKQAALTSERIRRSAILLSMKSLYLYPYAGSEMDALAVRIITETMKNEFDIVFLDLESGENKDSVDIMKEADLLVIVLPQAPAFWDKFLSREPEWLTGKRTCILLGGFFTDSRYGMNYYARKRNRTEIGEVAGVIPVNRGFFDAMSDGKVLDYFYRNQEVRKKEDNYEFMVQTKKAAENIRKKLFLP